MKICCSVKNGLALANSRAPNDQKDANGYMVDPQKHARPQDLSRIGSRVAQIVKETKKEVANWDEEQT